MTYETRNALAKDVIIALASRPEGMPIKQSDWEPLVPECATLLFPEITDTDWLSPHPEKTGSLLARSIQSWLGHWRPGNKAGNLKMNWHPSGDAYVMNSSLDAFDGSDKLTDVAQKEQAEIEVAMETGDLAGSVYLIGLLVAPGIMAEASGKLLVKAGYAKHGAKARRADMLAAAKAGKAVTLIPGTPVILGERIHPQAARLERMMHHGFKAKEQHAVRAKGDEWFMLTEREWAAMVDGLIALI